MIPLTASEITPDKLSRIRGICFDMDGVLTDTEPLGNRILGQALLRQNCRADEAQERCLLGVNMQTVRKYLLSWFPGCIDPDRFIADWCEMMHDEIHLHGLPVKPGAGNVLRALRERGYLLALCTSNTASVVNDYLAVAGWDSGIFDSVITGDLVAHGKPAPDIYLMGAEHLGLDPADCLGVEDSFNGVQSVRAAGMRCVMIPDTMPFSDRFSPYVDILLPDLYTLLSVTERSKKS